MQSLLYFKKGSETILGSLDPLFVGESVSPLEFSFEPAHLLQLKFASRRSACKSRPRRIIHDFVKMLDQTPGEMIIALRQGKIDLALTLHGIDLLSRDFYARKLASVRSLVALPVSHRFATERQVSLSQLKGETFVRGSDDVVPGYTQRIVQFCRKYGGFRPRLGTIDRADGLVETLALAANEEAISIQPAFISHLKVPNVLMVPIADAGATWDLFIVWQQGKMASPLRTLLKELNLKSQ